MRPSNLRAVVAEKPSVARDIARVLGAGKRANGYFSGSGLVVTWAIGHLVQLAEPHQINPEWRAWRRASLPILPGHWPLVVDQNRKDQFEIVKRILTSPKVESIVCATDAGREGELIFRQIYEAAGARKSVERLWISSLTPAAIRQGFARLRPSREFDDLAAAARARSRADWLVGMNLTRAYTLDHRKGGAGKEVLSVGRVQTPTLAMIVERELAIRNFVPEDYLEVQANFDAREGRVYRGTYFKIVRGKRQTRLPADGEEAAPILERAKLGRADIMSVKKARKRLAPPLLYDLTELQRHANRLFGFSANRTLELAQRLYEKYKAITYPRTDSRHLSTEVARGLPGIAQRVASKYDDSLIAEGTGERPLSKRFVDDSKVTDHHAIIPTGAQNVSLQPTSAAAKILDLINRRLLQAWHGDHKYSSTTVITRIAFKANADHYLSTGTAVDEEGWKVLDIKTTRKRPVKKEQPKLPGGLEKGRRVKVLDAKAVKKRTRPPPRFTEATLLTAMESAGKTLDSKQLSEAMKERGIGTPATRASIIETLLKRDYAVRDKKQLRATDRGILLLETVHPKVRSPAMTGEWESKLRGIERGDGGFDAFMKGIEEFVREVVGGNGSHAADAPSVPTPSASAAIASAPSSAPGRPNKGARTPRAKSEPPTGASGQPGHGRDKAPRKRQASSRPSGSHEARRRPPSPGRTSRQNPGIAAQALPPAEDPTGRPADFGAGHRPPERPTSPIKPRAKSSERPPTRPGDREPGSADSLNDASPSRPGGTLERRRFQPEPARLEAAGGPQARSSPRDASVPAGRLRDLLHRRFGHPSFRPHQEEVCKQVTAGRDVLLVMPTGAGKSLCYQLPGVARGGTTLVISPLIALMDDQAEKLLQEGFRAARIHSGRDRLESRQVCRDYLNGNLDFLYIAPERLGVRGFPELLARRTPGLVAIDEAHCISMWGHDFRPDYRRLRERVPALRPAPVIALTATATPRVQRDIIQQLGLEDCKESIHGFRRENLEIELVEITPSLRPPALLRLLQDQERRPAIVYAPTRKAAEEQAEILQAGFRAAAYHAGMLAEDRERIQAAFLGGKLEIIVATIAFGMGIDKPDVRTVVHTGLPGSIEGYYQEIGRAGRDGLPARAVLLHSWIDRKTHEFFLGRDYPEPELLAKLFDSLSDRPIPFQDLVAVLSADPQITEKAIEKLWTYKGVRFDADENAFRGDDSWQAPYLEQRDFRYRQLDRVTDFARSHDCRMLVLVRHFGDLEDSLKPCGQCDNCAPETCALKKFRPPTAQEAEVMKNVMWSLRDRDRQSVGRLFKEFAEHLPMKRGPFERLVDATARAGLARLETDSFVTPDGREIDFRRMGLTAEGRAARNPAGNLKVPLEGAGLARVKKRKTEKRAATTPKSRRKKARAKGRQLGLGAPPDGDVADELIEAALRAWRKTEAQRRKVPAFRIFSNRSLAELVDRRPSGRGELLAVPGIGPQIVKNFGTQILEVIRTASR